MIIKNVSKKIELPDDLKKAIDKVRSQLEVSKNELLIIQKARYSESASVEQLVRERQFLNKEVVDLRKDIKEKKQEFDVISGVIEKNKKEFEELNEKIVKIREEDDVLEKKKLDFEVYREEKEAEMFEKSNELKKREEEIIEKENLANEKLEEFNQFINKIK